jgi:uncharacterized protein YndB with AHSA1/START domain
MTQDTGRTIDLSIEVPGTPEEVWTAIATGPGITSWFVPAELEERDGGEVRHDFGEMGSDTGRVVAWDAPRRLVLEGHASNGGVLAFEWLVEAKGGDACVVRLVTSGFGPGEEWDGDFDGMSAGWLLFLENLRLHLTHFRGGRATTAVPLAMVAGDNARAWKELCGAFGVDPSLAAGDAVQVGPWAARVEHVTAAPAVRHCSFVFADGRGTGMLAAEGNGDQVVLSGYAYFYGDEAAASAEAWRAAWSDGLRTDEPA